LAFEFSRPGGSVPYEALPLAASSIALETANSIKADLLSWKGQARNSNLLFLPDLDSLNLFKGQLVPRSIINPGGRLTCMSGNPLRDLDCAARIHVFGNATGEG
jgi:hypothetical protein